MLLDTEPRFTAAFQNVRLISVAWHDARFRRAAKCRQIHENALASGRAKTQLVVPFALFQKLNRRIVLFAHCGVIPACCCCSPMPALACTACAFIIAACAGSALIC